MAKLNFVSLKSCWPDTLLDQLCNTLLFDHDLDYVLVTLELAFGSCMMMSYSPGCGRVSGSIVSVVRPTVT